MGRPTTCGRLWVAVDDAEHRGAAAVFEEGFESHNHARPQLEN
ncbi:hypothetical protein [Pseudenhygromyxa sp. WMMC2535]|nr:hypothetical protein [Pseudenhygromyxa sp. WMMC2535]